MIKQNPFTLYDFLGYLVPGFFTLITFLIISKLGDDLSLYSPESIILSNSLKFEDIFYLIIVAYILGHITSFLSSVTVEKYSIWRYTYPSKYLLNMKDKNDGYFNSYEGWKDVIWRLLLLIFLLPMVIPDYILGQLMGFKKYYKKGLDKELRRFISKSIVKLLNKYDYADGTAYVKEEEEDFVETEVAKYDFFRIISHFIYEHSRNHQTKMNNYVALYGFTRNMCFIFNLLTWFIVLKILLEIGFQGWNTHLLLSTFLSMYLEKGIDLNWTYIAIIVGFSLISYITFAAFMKFYRRFTLEGFMVLCILDKD